MTGAHWIGSIAFELRSREAKALDPVRSAIRNDLGSIVVNPLQRALDRAERPERLVRHRRIEVDLGRLVQADLQGDCLARRIAEGLEAQLDRAGAGASGAPSPVADEAEQLAAFLETGVLAWAAPGEALEAICAALLARGDADMARLAARLRPLLARAPPAAERLVRQCPAALVRRIAGALAAMETEPGAGRDGTRSFIGGASAPGWAAAITGLARGESGAAEVMRTVAGWDATPTAVKADADRLIPDVLPAPSGPGARPIELGKTPDSAELAQEEAAEDRGLPVPAAGMVLLHPYLTGLFGVAGLLDAGGGFAGPEEMARGVLLLHFVATGNEEAAEPDLALPKLLCGMDFAAVVPRRIGITGLERAETEALLVATISHWGALGDISPAALRETFLERSGHLRREGEDWRLVVERRGVDVLLDRLPWAISLVKTGFMARPLRVEWR